MRVRLLPEPIAEKKTYEKLLSQASLMSPGPRHTEALAKISSLKAKIVTRGGGLK